MSFLPLVILLSWVSMMPYACATQAHDRELHFPSYYFFAERRLMNHTIKTLLVKSLDDCEYLCYLEDACVSLNIKNPYPNRTHECELNNSTHMEHHGALINNPLYYYRGAKNNCGKSTQSCKNNSTCQSGFTDKGYRCVFTAAYKGEHCEEDIDECAAQVDPCNAVANSSCKNTNGSYICHCKDGFIKNGSVCEDIDECAAPVDPCKEVANSACNNTSGSYKCLCKDGFVKNGAVCEADVCQNYTTLSDAERKETYVLEWPYQCDSTLKGWYRFEGAAGTKMAVTCPSWERCGGHVPGWLTGGHPTVTEGIVRRKVCFHKLGDCCEEMFHIQVKNCGSYYIYELTGTPGCDNRYCGTD